MAELTDHELLTRFARTGDEAAFATLVTRHVNLVWSAARRFTGDDTLASEVTQAVFIILAQKAGRISAKTVLTGWLYQTARLTAANALKENRRRQHREHQAYMEATLTPNETNEAWQQLAPVLDEAMHALRTADRDAVLLRFFENKTLADVGAALGVTEDAARVRVNRALDKLRALLAKQGIKFGVTLLATAVVENSVQAAPAALAAKVSVLAAKGVAVAISTASLVHGTMKTLAWAKYKSLITYGTSAVVVGTVILFSLPKKPLVNPAPTVSRNNHPNSPEIYAITAPMGGVALQPDDKIVVSCGCAIFAINTNSGIISMNQSGAFRFFPDGSLDRTFQCNIDSVNVSAPQSTHITAAPDGRLLLTGVFHAVDGKPQNGYAMLLPDGKLDESFQPWRGFTNPPARHGRAGALYPVALLTNGNIAVPSGAIACRYPYLTTYLLDASGTFLHRPGIDIISNDWSYARMSAVFRDGGFGVQRSIDWHRTNHTSWDSWPPKHRISVFPLWGDPPSAADVSPELAALFKEAPIELCRYAVSLPDGGAILAVEATNNTSQLMRFDKNWIPDFSFTNTFQTHVNSYLTLIHQPDDKLLLTGEISKLNGESFPGIVRLLRDGATDPDFHCTLGGDARIMGMALQKDGKIVIVGFFTEVNGIKSPYMARLNSDGSLDESFSRHFITRDGLKVWQRVPVQYLAAKTPPANTSATNIPTPVVAELRTVLITSITLANGVALTEFSGNPSQTYFLQAKDSLDGTSWNTISTNQSDASGNGSFRDPEAKNHPTRFYRIAAP